MDGVVLGVSLVFFISPGGDYVLEVGDGARVATTEVFEGATVVGTVLEEVDELLVGDVDYCGAPHGTREVAGELFLDLVPLVDRVLLK
jgi:hypothetical protein